MALSRMLTQLTGTRRSKKIHTAGAGALRFHVADGSPSAQYLQAKQGIIVSLIYHKKAI